MFSDLKYAFRQLGKSKGITAAVVLSLALCIGANALIFSLLYTIVLKPLPFKQPGQLVEVYNSYPKLGVVNYRSNVLQYLDYAKHPELFAGVALYLQTAETVGDVSGPTRTDLARVTPSFFDMLGIKPAIGQFFRPDAGTSGDDQYAILSDSFWRAHFGADPGVVGRQIIIEQLPYVIIGVAPASAQYFSPNTALFIPQTWNPKWFNELSRHTKDVSIIGRLFARLQPGITLQQAAPRIDGIDRSYYDAGSAAFRRYVDQSGARSIVSSLQEQQAAAQKDTLYLLQCGALFVLLIGCINVANLLLARATIRQPELAIRYALGGSRWQLARQLLTESILLSVLGGASGIGLSALGAGAVNRYSLAMLGAGSHFRVNGSMLIFASAISLLVGLLTGAFPVFRIVRHNLLAGIQQSSRSTSQSRHSRALGSLLASGQVALSLILLVGTGLLVRSLVRVLAVSPAMDVKNVTTARVAVPPKWFNDPASVARFRERALESLGQIPGVEAVGLATNTPMRGSYSLIDLFIYGEGGGAGNLHPLVSYFSISPGYFGAMGIRILNGRTFDAHDSLASIQSVIIDRRLAELYFPGQNPLGRRIALFRLPTKDDDWMTIVGVVQTVPYNGLDDLKGVPFVYLPFDKAPSLGHSFFLRSQRSASDLIPQIRERIRAINPEVPVYLTGSMADFVDASLDSRRNLLTLLAAFAGIALALSAVGIYSVLAYDVSQRVREIGIRGAIGAAPRQILGLVLRQGTQTIGIGIGTGLLGALSLGRLMAGRLFEVAPYDPPTLGVISLLLLGIGLLASLLPAWRAARIDPVIALRAE